MAAPEYYDGGGCRFGEAAVSRCALVDGDHCLLLHKLERAQRGVAAFADDDVVMHGNVQQLSDVDDFSRHSHVS